MGLVFFVIAWLAGGLIGSLTLGQSIVILRFGLPTALHWYRLGWLTAVRPLTRYVISLTMLSIAFVLTTWAAWKFFPAQRTGYLIGVGVALAYALTHSGETSDSLADFVQTNLAYISHEKVDALVTKLGVADRLDDRPDRFPKGRGAEKGAAPAESGCEQCRSVPSSRSSLTIAPVRLLFDSSHSSFTLCRCPNCGQSYLEQFHEILDGDRDKGKDHVWVRWMPLTPDEKRDIEALCPEDASARPDWLWGRLSDLMRRRGRLIEDPEGRFFWSSQPWDPGDLMPPG